MILLDGKKLAQELQQRIAHEIEDFQRPLKLFIIQVGHDPASDVYIGQKLKAAAKVGITAVHEILQDAVTTQSMTFLKNQP